MIKYMLLITFVILGCDSKQRKSYKIGKTIVCVKENYFTENSGAIINNSNASLSSEEKGTGPMVTGSKDGYRVNGTFYSEDDCAVIDQEWVLQR